MWKHEVVSALPPSPSFSIRLVTKPNGCWIQQNFSIENETQCVFEVAPDGRTLHSWSLPSVHPEDVVELCSEPVMRTVLSRLGYPALHAAALSRNGQAILVMGQKGAGKSTLASALQQEGWTLLADDLVRVAKIENSWRAFPGVRRNKLHRDSMNALGYRFHGAHRRWKGALPATADDGKLLVPLQTPLQDKTPVALHAVLCLSERTSSPELITQPLVGPIAVLRVAEHLIRDPLPPHLPPSKSNEVLSQLLQQATIYSVRLPDELSRLSDSAKTLSASLLPSQTA